MKLRILAIGLTAIFGLVLQATILKRISWFGLFIVPDFVLIVAVSYGLLRGPWYGATIGLTAGLLADLAAGGVIGAGALARMATGFVAGLLEKVIFKDNLLVPFIALFAATFLSEGIFILVSSSLGWHFIDFFPLLLRLTSMALYNAILAPFIYRQFYGLESRQAGF